tara:strand:+ start:993 stop:1838 length:846 start_codon:yes stop_codon:yes gene_type:complete
LIKYVYISDLFYGQVNGGAEANDDVLIKSLEHLGHKVDKIQSHLFAERISSLNTKNTQFIVSNFCNLSLASKSFLKQKANYVIYEHDHKYLASRNPAKFRDFKAPENKLINLEFYQRAKKIFCQSDFHLKIVRKNLGTTANLFNVSGNLWDKKHLDKMRELSFFEKTNLYAILESKVAHKNTDGAIKFCEQNNMPYTVIAPMEYDKFLNTLSDKRGLVFFPRTPETLCRVAVEARMMNLEIFTNSLLGAKYEPWFTKKGIPLIEQMNNKFNDVYNELQKSL